MERRGITVFRFDFSGCGESEGNFKEVTIQKNADDLDAAVNFIKSKYPGEKIHITGYCHGALISAFYASQNDVAGLALLSAIYRYNDPELVLRGVLFIDRWLKRKYKDTDGGRNVHMRNYRSTTKLHMKKMVRKITCPMLVVHGGKDKLVPRGHAFRYYDYTSGTKQLHVVESANHFFDKQSEEETAQKIEDWLKSIS